MKIAVFWDVSLCNIVKLCRRFLFYLLKEAENFSEKLHLFQITRCHRSSATLTFNETNLKAIVCEVVKWIHSPPNNDKWRAVGTRQRNSGFCAQWVLTSWPNISVSSSTPLPWNEFVSCQEFGFTKLHKVLRQFSSIEKERRPVEYERNR